MKYSYQFIKETGFIVGEVIGSVAPNEKDLPQQIGQIVLDFALSNGFKSYVESENKIIFLKHDVNGNLVLDETKSSVVL